MRRTYLDLVDAARGGSRRAFDELVARFRPMALSVARRHLADERLAEDAVQEALLAVFLKLGHLRNSVAFPSWLKAIVYSACRNMRKGNVVEVPLEGAEAALMRIDSAEGPEELCVRWQTREMVARTLEALPGASREACRMRYVQGLPYKHISEALGVPVGTIKRRLHDARAAIIKTIAGREPGLIRVGYMPVSDHLLAMVSHAMGGGCRVALRKFLSWDALERSIRDGTVDAVFAMVPLAMHLAGKGVDLVYVLDGHHEGSAVVGRGARGGLGCGKRLMLPHRFSTHRLLLHALEGEGGGSRGASVGYAAPSFLNSMYLRGTLDAFFCAEPWSTLCESLHGGTVLARSGDLSPGHACCGLVVRAAFARGHADLVGAYVAAMRGAAKRVAEDVSGAAAIQSRYTGVPRDVAERVLRAGHVQFDDLEPDRDALARSMDLALAAGMLDAPCDLGGFVSRDFL
jgi:NitT/TauT family transport system substrate-binding protein